VKQHASYKVKTVQVPYAAPMLQQSKHVRITLKTSTSRFFKNFEKPTVNFGSYRKHDIYTPGISKLDRTLGMNDKIRASQRSGSKPGTLGAFLEKVRVPGIQCFLVFTKAEIAAKI